MPEKSTSNLVSIDDVAGLSKPATVLIERISDAVGGLCRPWQMIRVAKAEAEVALIQASKDIQLTELKQRTIQRFLAEEQQRQINMEAIAKRALPDIEETAKPEDVDKDWLTCFFDRARLVSNEEMQALWARVLAGEANHPGSFSKRTINLIAELSRSDAETITLLRTFCWQTGTLTILIFDPLHDIYQKNKLTYKKLVHLQSLGLISINDGLSSFSLPNVGPQITVQYFSRYLRLTIPEGPKQMLPIGRVVLTELGRELMQLCQSSPIEGFWDYVVGVWQKLSPSEILPPD